MKGGHGPTITIEGFHCMVMHIVVYTGCPTGPEV